MVEKIEINLIPAEYVVREKRFSINISIAVPVAISFALVFISLLWLNIVNSKITLEKEKIANLEREIEVNKTIQEEIKTLEKKQAEMQVKVVGLKSISVDRSKWIEAFELYTNVLPENTWLTSIEEVEGKSIVINGMTEADAEVGQIMNRLLNSPSVSNVILVEMKDIGRNGLQKSFMIQHSFVQTSVD